MKLAIVIPVLNQIDVFTQCIESICKTAILKGIDRQHIMVIVVDSASTDPIFGVIHDAEKRLNPWINFEYIRLTQNVGVTTPWNIGLKRAMEIGADVICISNSDVVYGPNVLDHCALVAKDEGACFPLSIQGGPLPPDFEKRALEQSAYNPLHCSKVDTRGFAGWCFFLSKETVEKVGYFDEQFTLWYQDTDYHYRLRTAGITPWEVRSCLLHHFESRTIKSMPGGFDCYGWRQQDEKRFFAKHPGK